MTVMGMDAWVTSAVEDENVDKALILAASLRRVFTVKKLVVLTNFTVSKKLREKLASAFDLVLPLEQENPNGLNLEDCAKVEGFSLVAFNKCMYLSPNPVVLRNCDELFEKYEKFTAAWRNESGVDFSVYLFTPSMESCQALRKTTHTNKADASGGCTTRVEHFAKSFNFWIENNFPGFQKLDEGYNVPLNLENGSMKRCLKETLRKYPSSNMKGRSKGRSEPLVIGSVKTNVGHTESVSGITGIIKVLLAMKNEVIPKHLHLERLNPAINLELIPGKIPLEAVAWPKREDKPRIAGISSFGISGTDGHVILQEPPEIFQPYYMTNLSVPFTS